MKEILTLKEPIGQVTSAKHLFSKIRKINIDLNQENVLIFYLHSDARLKKVEVLFKGGLNSCIVDPKTILRRALRLNVNSFIIAHNHPSGSLNPSQEDEAMFENLQKAGAIISLQCSDSIIFNKTSFYSMNEI